MIAMTTCPADHIPTSNMKPNPPNRTHEAVEISCCSPPDHPRPSRTIPDHPGSQTTWKLPTSTPQRDMDPCPGCWPPACPRPNISKFQSLAHGCTSHLLWALYILLTCCRWQIDSMCFTSESKVVCLLFRFLWGNVLSPTPGRFGQCLFSWTVAECHSTRGPLTVHHTPESVVDCIVAPLPRGSNPFLMNSLPHRPPKLVGCWDKSSLFYQTSKHVRFWFGRKAKQETILNHSSANSAKSCPRIPLWLNLFFTINFFGSQFCS